MLTNAVFELVQQFYHAR